jgi:hypothetical protein
MWKYTKWPKGLKWLISAIFAIFVLIRLIPSSSTKDQGQQETVTNSVITNQPTDAPTVTQQEEVANKLTPEQAYANQVKPLIAQYIQQDTIVTNSIQNHPNDNASNGFANVRADAESSLVVFKSIQQQLNAITPPATLADAHAHLTSAVGYTVEGVQQTITAIDDNDSRELSAVGTLMDQANTEMSNAAKEVNAYTNNQ